MWLDFSLSLCNEDITKLENIFQENAITCLNVLQMKSERAKIERRIIKES